MPDITSHKYFIPVTTVASIMATAVYLTWFISSQFRGIDSTMAEQNNNFNARITRIETLMEMLVDKKQISWKTNQQNYGVESGLE